MPSWTIDVIGNADHRPPVTDRPTRAEFIEGTSWGAVDHGISCCSEIFFNKRAAPFPSQGSLGRQRANQGPSRPWPGTWPGACGRARLATRHSRLGSWVVLWAALGCPDAPLSALREPGKWSTSVALTCAGLVIRLPDCAVIAVSACQCLSQPALGSGSVGSLGKVAVRVAVRVAWG